jgi:ribulose-phosphate 3-epimerase
MASNPPAFAAQLAKVAPLSGRLHIDFMDGQFAEPVSVAIDEVAVPDGKIIDIHIMYEHPERYVAQLAALRPQLVIVHAESRADIPKLAADLRDRGIKTGVSLLPETAVEAAAYLLPHVQHVLIFSGHLGHFGGHADLALLDKVRQVKTLAPRLEIGWDGGVNEQNAADLAAGSVDVLNVGGFIQHSSEPQVAYATLQSKISS